MGVVNEEISLCQMEDLAGTRCAPVRGRAALRSRERSDGRCRQRPAPQYGMERVMSRKSGVSRRKLLLSAGAGVGGALLLGSRPVSASAAEGPGREVSDGALVSDEHAPSANFRPVAVPNGAKLSWRLVNGVKVFHLVAEEVEHEFAPGLKARCWGYNGRVHGPCLEAMEGDRVRIYVTNRLPAGTAVHWHGVLLPNGMDGVGGLNQAPRLGIKVAEKVRLPFVSTSRL